MSIYRIDQRKEVWGENERRFLNPEDKGLGYDGNSEINQEVLNSRYVKEEDQT